MSTPEHGDMRGLDAEPPPDLDAELKADPETDKAEAPELSIGFSPRQVLGGFALLAGILVWLFRRRGKGG